MAADSQDFSVVSSLFGIDPDQLAAQRQRADTDRINSEAARVAALPPQQQMTEQQLAGGAGVGRALAGPVQGALGIQQPVDPQMKFARTMQGIMQGMQQSGVDMSDPVAAQQYVGKALVQSGYPQQGMMALENARLRKQEADKAQADIELKKAQAVKDLAEGDPVAKAFASGHVTAPSYAAYISGGKKDLSVLQATDKYMIAQTADGVMAVNKSNPQDTVRLGDLKPAGGDNKQKSLDSYNLATAPYVKEDGSVDWASFQKADPAAATQAKLDARVAFGASNLASVTGSATPSKETAAALARGDMPWPTARTPAAQALIAEALKINPTASADTYTTKQATMVAFAKGKQGDTARSFNVLNSHLDVLDDAIGALKNGQGTIPNAIKNKVSEFTGGTAITDFNAVKGVVADELAKAIIGGTNALGDRESIAATLKGANSPQQLRNAVQRYRQLAQGQLDGLEQQYKAGTFGKDDFKTRILGRAPEAPSESVGANILSDGMAAAQKGQAEYATWWKSKTPAERAAYKAAVAAAKGQ